MVPARLALRNFLCYRDSPPLDLEHVRVACLTGDNGNGKSALLDAITWALWGRARGRDRDLISLGQSEMEVEFEFYLGETRHRVIRKCRRIGAKDVTQSTLDFQVWDGAGWKVQSGSTQSETQRTLLEALKLSYETFVNSAFLMQGKADAFTVKSPGERKQVLAEILNLDQYDTYEDRAKERRNECARLAEMIERQVHDAEVELARLPGFCDERDATRAELDQRQSERGQAALTLHALQQSASEAGSLRRDIADAERSRDEAARLLLAAEAQIALRRAEIEGDDALIAEGPAVREGFTRLQAARDRLRDLTAEAEALRTQLSGAEQSHDDAAAEAARAEARACAHQAEIERHTAIAADAPAIRDGYARLTRARAALADQDARLGAVSAVQRRLRPLTDAIAGAEAGLREELRVQQAEAARLERLAARIAPLRRDREAAEREQAGLDALAMRITTARAEEVEAHGEVQTLQARNRHLRDEMDGLKRKFDELRAAVERGEGDCPLCRADLGHDQLRRVEESYQAEGRRKGDEHRANQKRIQDREAAAQARAEEARRLEADLQQRRAAWNTRVAVLARDLAEAEQASAALTALRAGIARIEMDIAQGNVAQEERAQAALLEQQAAAAGYDEQAHARARRDLAACAGYDEQHQQLITAETGLAAARTALAAETATVEGWRTRREEAAARAEVLRGRLAALPVDAARCDVELLAPYEARHQHLLAAETRLPVARAALASEESAAAGWRRQHDETCARLAGYRERLAALGEAEAQLPAAQARVADLDRRCSELSRALGAVEQEIDRLEAMQRATDERRRRLAEAKRERSIYEELVTAFGRRGVQALIIDAALPEIEAAANDLLARMTNNRMHVSLDTQRLNQKGTITETLDIKIADEWGTRSYEMYSGGEAFRINLALRIALSKLLARRAGAPLPTLVIDEGFGTQDAAGRERLLEAITAIQEDFRCLLLVTHIDELKDLFDIRIEVTKTGEGSVARVVAA